MAPLPPLLIMSTWFVNVPKVQSVIVFNYKFRKFTQLYKYELVVQW